MKKYNIPFSPPDIIEDEINEVIDTLKSGWITTGPKTKELERRLSEFTTTPNSMFKFSYSCFRISIKSTRYW